MAMAQVSLFNVDKYLVPICTLKVDKLHFEDIYSINFKIERQLKNSAAYGQQQSSATKETNEPATKSISSREQRQAIEIKEEYSG